jgi:hypothetical protein
VTVIPGINHIELTTDPRAVPVIVASVHGARLKLPRHVRYWHKADITIALNHVRFRG